MELWTMGIPEIGTVIAQAQGAERLGWDGITSPDDKIRDYKACDVHLLKNKEAIALFNRLKGAGKRVAIHYHSTC